MRLLNRMWQSPRLIPVLSVLTVIALAGAAYAVFGVLAVDEQRERDRIEADLASCERGNRLRLQVIALGEAGQDMVEGILDIVLPLGASARVDEIRSQLEPVLSRHQARIDDIQLTHCQAVTPGSPKGTS